ncbi:RNA polymerase sigma factor SigX [Bacillus sp. FJAT-47783]|uniref:RNA polymerase sigma factor SigX n=1 Tax=Bacillus sp. FJAT-47783 TaxID=2922712 RepID=UPI001FADC959|nr:RNA polymerase sigma factor SigX [Bacillus sp. FJAT-47783]
MEDAFEQLYEKYHHDLFQFLFYMVKDKNVAEDLVQDVYIKVLKSYNRFEGRSSEKTWLFSIARHVAIDYFRKQKSLRQRILEKFDFEKTSIMDEGPLPEEIAIEREDIQLLYKALDACNVNQRSVILLRYFKDLSISETASILGWTESKVKTTAHRAIKSLKKEMERIKDEQEVDSHDQKLSVE